MPRRPREAPDLPGLELVKTVGSGGFADVFLYRDLELGRRDVAVKVLDPTALPDGSSLQNFQVEAELMASVSEHPYIVQVFQSGQASDGRPYLVMEYYPNDNFWVRCRRTGMSVSESLAVGVRIASAVETAHRENIIHHDIKPANILTSKYELPGLTDFGIAVVQEHADSGPGALSIPWSSPEALRDEPTDKRSDVYSLGATVYTLLAGRSPYEQPGSSNRPASLMRRAKEGRLPLTGRDDVPQLLERVLRRAMAIDPADRQESAAEFGRDLQAVESELGYTNTKLDLEGFVQPSSRPSQGDLDETEAKPVVISPLKAPPASARPQVVAEVPTFEKPAGVRSSQVSASESPTGSGRFIPRPEPENDTLLRQAGDSLDKDHEAPAPEREFPIRLVFGLGVASLVAIVLVLVLGASANEPIVDDSGGVDITEVNDGPIDGSIQLRPSPLEEIVATSAGGLNRFSWEPHEAASQYNVIPDGGSGKRQSSVLFETDAECIDVQVVSIDGIFSDPTRGCV